ncbi:hypothetical protein [Herbaspirillum sp.]|uniref:hypothetical protein n=1 Tax=Herbaspirillum sp. TaxID=1890675 RepID=UPI001B0C4597|nr:hypothetical protein [Herbaspirillum sp.]MBO9536487.1 hypothetical protein [Herbaspirillum sp.]
MPKIVFLVSHAPVLPGLVWAWPRWQSKRRRLVGAGFISIYEIKVAQRWEARYARRSRASGGFGRSFGKPETIPQVLRKEGVCKEENAGKGQTTIFPAVKKQAGCYKRSANVTTGKRNWTGGAAGV